VKTGEKRWDAGITMQSSEKGESRAWSLTIEQLLGG